MASQSASNWPVLEVICLEVWFPGQMRGERNCSEFSYFLLHENGETPMGKFPRKSYDAQKDLSDSLLLSLSCRRAVDTCQNHQGIVVLQQLLWAETTDELPQDQISKLT